MIRTTCIRATCFVTVWLIAGVAAMPLGAQKTPWDKHMQAGQKALQQQRLSEAEKQFKAAIQESEKSSRQPLKLAEADENLAEVYREQGRYADSETLYRQSLAIREKAAGPSHLSVALTLDSLADLLAAQARYPQAEPLYKRAKDIREKAIAEHPDIYVNGVPQAVQPPQ